MVGKGAKNIVLVSRSGSATGKVKELVDELSILGANIAVHRCDVTDSAAVNSLISDELTGMPPVRGIIHAAMVLHVSSQQCSFTQTSTDGNRTYYLRK